VRVAVEHLKKTGEVAIERANRYSLATIIKYEDYQCKGDDEGNQKGNQKALKRQTEGTQTATSKNKESLSPNGDTPAAEGKPERKPNRMQELIGDWEAPDSVKAELWKFISMRRDMGKKMAAVSIPELLQQLDALGWFKATAALKHTVANGFTGLVIPKDIGDAATGGLREI
jgi:hypothetical protein